MSLLFSLGHPRPNCLPWVSSAFFLTLYSYGLLLTSLGFPGLITSYSSLGFMGLPSTPYSLCLHFFEPAAARSYFFSHHTLPMGLLFAISLFSSSFKPIFFLKAYLFILWTCDWLFLLLGLNGFCSLSFANFFSVCVTGLGFLPFIWVPQKRPLTFSPLNIWSIPTVHIWIKDLPVLSTSFLSFPSRAFLNYGPFLIYIYIYISFPAVNSSDSSNFPKW